MTLVLIGAGCMAISACNTMRGAGQDVGRQLPRMRCHRGGC